MQIYLLTKILHLTKLKNLIFKNFIILYLILFTNNINATLNNNIENNYELKNPILSIDELEIKGLSIKNLPYKFYLLSAKMYEKGIYLVRNLKGNLEIDNGLILYIYTKHASLNNIKKKVEISDIKMKIKNIKINAINGLIDFKDSIIFGNNIEIYTKDFKASSDKLNINTSTITLTNNVKTIFKLSD